jgi:hypothetical protein
VEGSGRGLLCPVAHAEYRLNIMQVWGSRHREARIGAGGEGGGAPQHIIRTQWLVPLWGGGHSGLCRVNHVASLQVYRSFGATFCLHHLGRRVIRPQQRLTFSYCFVDFPFDPEDGDSALRRNVCSTVLVSIQDTGFRTGSAT